MKNELFLDVADSFLQSDKSKYKEQIKNNIKVSYYEIDESNKKRIKREEGKYYTISYNEDILNNYPKHLIKEVTKILKILKKDILNYGTTLIVGLGNSSVLCDSLGPRTTNKVIATNHYIDFLTIPKVALFVPEVIGKTGISSFDLIKMVVKDLKPSSIIVIDSLLTKNAKRLNNCIEISSGGIIPGSALATNKMITSKTFNIPLIAIGVPLVIKKDNYLYTATNIEEVVNKTSDILATSLNNLFLK